MAQISMTAEERIEMLTHDGFERESVEAELDEMDAMGRDCPILSEHWSSEETAESLVSRMNSLLQSIKQRFMIAQEVTS